MGTNWETLTARSVSSHLTTLNHPPHACCHGNVSDMRRSREDWIYANFSFCMDHVSNDSMDVYCWRHCFDFFFYLIIIYKAKDHLLHLSSKWQPVNRLQKSVIKWTLNCFIVNKLRSMECQNSQYKCIIIINYFSLFFHIFLHNI